MDGGESSSGMSIPKLLTYREAAKIVRCSERHLWGIVKNGGLRVFRDGSKVLIDLRDLLMFIESRKSGGQGA